MQLSDEHIEGLLHTFRTFAEQYAEAKATRTKFEEARKIKKSRLMIQAEKEAGLTSASKQECYAYAHPEYQAVVDHLVEAVEQETSLYWRMESLRIEFDAWRSLNASERFEKRAYGVGPGTSSASGAPATPRNMKADDGLL